MNVDAYLPETFDGNYSGFYTLRKEALCLWVECVNGNKDLEPQYVGATHTKAGSGY